MLLILLAYAGGALTIASPCVLPVLPFVFARAGRPFVRSTLPMLAGMALTFTAIATLAAVGGGWAVAANGAGRAAAIALLALFGLALLLPRLADRLTRPLVRLGNRLSSVADREHRAGRDAVLPAVLLGVATGLLWAPCAGPVLGLILTGAALGGASIRTTILLLAYAAGAATALALALLVGGRVFAVMKRSLGLGEWIRRIGGVAVLAAVAAIALGLDTGLLTRLSLASTASVEQNLVDRLHGRDIAAAPATTSPAPTLVATAEPRSLLAPHGATLPPAPPLDDQGPMPSLAGAVRWLNSPPLTGAELRGKVVLVDFWTYSCINCLRALPYVQAWAAKYKDQGLVVIGVHAPEFAFEKNIGNVRAAVARLGVTYPVAIDNDYAIWRGFNNEYWPAHYFIDARGRIRHHHFGEGDYAQSEAVIQALLRDAGHTELAHSSVAVAASGAEAAADERDVGSPETYIGYQRAENFNSPGGRQRGAPFDYRIGDLEQNEWGLAGNWTVDAEQATLNRSGGAIAYRFHARDLHLVLGTAAGASPVRFVVTVDGKPPGPDHGADVAADGTGVVDGERLYQLVRQAGPITDHTFSVRFLDPNLRAYAFTFG